MTSMPEPSEIDPQDLQFGEDGLPYTVARILGAPPGAKGTVWVGVAIGLLAWVPLLVLAAIERTLVSGPTIAVRQSFGTHARLILAIPLFFFAESLFAKRISEILRKMRQEQLIAPRDLPRFMNAWRQARRWWNSWRVEAALVAVTVVSLYVGLRTDLPAGVSTWRTTAEGHLSFAGWWYTLVSLPFFQFLLWRWAWRLLIWGRLLWRISRLDLQLIPTHPDRAAGLGMLGVAHVDLSPLSFACSAMLAATFAEQVMFGGAAVRQFAVSAAGILVGTVAVSIAPLLLFSRRLLEVKQRGLLDYGSLATGYVRAFDTKWLRGGAPRDEPILGTADLQSLADLGNSFSVISDMRLVPIAWSQIILLGASSLLPMLTLVLFEFPVNELIIRVFKSLLGI
jgi:hypothetical protein